MSKRMKNKGLSLLLLPFLLFALVGQGLASTLVLCIGEDDHIAIEMGQNCEEAFSQAPESVHNHSLDLAWQKASFRQAEHGCVDIPLLLGSADPNLSSVQYPQVIKNMIARASDALLSLNRPIMKEPVFPEPPAFRLAVLSALRSTVLLI
ncbi:MAG: hypothetical protein R3231_10145 [bacterium]|nr:hypothetical protein [bacterium]